MSDLKKKTSWYGGFYYSVIKAGDSFPYRRYTRRHRCIFVHIPKAAGTSILTWLGHEGARDHCTYREYQKVNPARFESYFKFAIVRHPVDRFLSLHSYFLAGGGGRRDARFSSLVNERYADVSAFIDFVEEEQLYANNVMFWPQTAFIYDINRNLMVDEVVRLEELPQRQEMLKQRIGIRKDIPQVNVGKMSKSSVSDANRQRIVAMYRRDFSLLGY